MAVPVKTLKVVSEVVGLTAKSNGLKNIVRNSAKKSKLVLKNADDTAKKVAQGATQKIVRKSILESAVQKPAKETIIHQTNKSNATTEKLPDWIHQVAKEKGLVIGKNGRININGKEYDPRILLKLYNPNRNFYNPLIVSKLTKEMVDNITNPNLFRTIENDRVLLDISEEMMRGTAPKIEFLPTTDPLMLGEADAGDIMAILYKHRTDPNISGDLFRKTFGVGRFGTKPLPGVGLFGKPYIASGKYGNAFSLTDNLRSGKKYGYYDFDGLVSHINQSGLYNSAQKEYVLDIVNRLKLYEKMGAKVNRETDLGTLLKSIQNMLSEGRNGYGWELYYDDLYKLNRWLAGDLKFGRRIGKMAYEAPNRRNIVLLREPTGNSLSVIDRNLELYPTTLLDESRTIPLYDRKTGRITGPTYSSLQRMELEFTGGLKAKDKFGNLELKHRGYDESLRVLDDLKNRFGLIWPYQILSYGTNPVPDMRTLGVYKGIISLKRGGKYFKDRKKTI